MKEEELKQAKGFILNNPFLDWLNGNVNKTGFIKTAKAVLKDNKKIGVDVEYKASDFNSLWNSYIYLIGNNFTIDLI